MRVLFYCLLALVTIQVKAAEMDARFDFERAYLPSYGSTRVVHQDEVAFMAPDAPYDNLLMGPLKPCQGIVIEHSGYVLAYHRSSASSLKFLPIIYQHMVESFKLSSERAPQITIYSAELNDERFSAFYAEAYEPHHGRLNSQRELMEAVRLSIADLLRVDAEKIVTIINPSKKVLDRHYIAESVVVDKRGALFMASIDDIKCLPAIEAERLHMCSSAVFGELDYKHYVYPPYMHVVDAPKNASFDFLRLGTTTQWPSYKSACAHCERISRDQIVWLKKCPMKGLSNLLRCARCKRSEYCKKSCQTADWIAGHKDGCHKAL